MESPAIAMHNYKNLDKKYSNEEYLILLNMLPFCLMQAIIKLFLRGTLKNIRRVTNGHTKYLSEWCYCNEPALYKLLFFTDITMVPLFINKKDDVIEHIVKWRLQINK